MRHPLREFCAARRCGYGRWAAVVLVAGDIRRSIRLRVLRERSEVHPLLVVDLELRTERAARRRELRERRRRALARPEAAAEWLLAEVELDAHFAAIDERDNKIAELDRQALEAEHRDDDERPA